MSMVTLEVDRGVRRVENDFDYDFLDMDEVGDPEDAAGVLITKEMFLDELDDHPDEKLSRDARAFVHDFSTEMHRLMREKTGGPKAKHHQRMWGGPKGRGKSGCANLDAFQYYLVGGNVYSTTALGYGYRVSKDQFYTFAESIPQKSWMMIDEIHMYTDSQGQAIRNHLLVECNALLRKRCCRMDCTSTKEWALPQSFKAELDCVLFPRPYTPASVKRDGVWKMPPFCYTYIDCVGPRPYAPQDLRHEWKLVPNSEKSKKRRKIVNPLQLYISAHMYDSWTAPGLGTGIMTNAADIKDAIREAGSERDDQAVGKSFVKAVNRAVLRGWMPEGRSIEHLEVWAESVKHDSLMDEKEMKRYLKMKGCINSGGRVIVDRFLETFILPDILEYEEDE